VSALSLHIESTDSMIVQCKQHYPPLCVSPQGTCVMTMLQLTVEEMWSLVWALTRTAALEMAIGFKTEQMGIVSSAMVSSQLFTDLIWWLS